MKRALIGAGGFAREIMSHMETKLPCFIDDEYYKENDDDIHPISKFDADLYEIIIAVGNPIDRNKIKDRLPENTKYFSFIHSSAILLDDDIEIGEGSIICAGVIITTNIKIGKHCHLNLQTTIGHDTIIGDFFTTSPGSKISGNCTIGNNVYIGTNSSIREKIKICDNVTIGLNSGVIKDILEPGVYGGVPSKKIKNI